MRLLLVLSLSTFLFACASVKYNYSPESVRFSYPEVGSVVEARLGEPLLDQGQRIEEDVLYVTSEFNPARYVVRPGKFIKIGEDEEYEFYKQDVIEGFSIYTGGGSSASSSASLRINKANGDACILRAGDLTICSSDAQYRKEKDHRFTSSNFRKTLIYSGRVGNKIRLSYREFSNGMARNAFTNEVEYDLSRGSEIGYSTAEIEVISATNTLIKYRVISNFE